MSTTEKLIPGPRNSKFTWVKAKLIIAHLTAGNFQGTAAMAAGVHHNTLANWLKAGLDEYDHEGNVTKPGKEPFRRFRQMVESAMATSEVTLVKSIAETDDWKAKAWVLARRNPQWSGRQTVEHVGSGGAALPAAQINLVIEGISTAPWVHREDDPAAEATDDQENEAHA